MKNISFVIFFLVSMVVISQNCDYSLKGEVIDFHNITPIENATIKVINSEAYAISDKDGKFTLKNLCNNKIEIEVAHLNCEAKTISVNVSENAFISVYLEHHLEELKEVVLNVNSRTESTSIEQSVKQKTIDNFTDKSLGDALNTISGVSSLNTGNTIVKPMIHGLHSSRLLIVNNNVRLFDQE